MEENEKMESIFVVVMRGKNIRRMAKIIGVAGRKEMYKDKCEAGLCIYYQIQFADGQKDFVAVNEFPSSCIFFTEDEAKDFVQFCEDAALLCPPENT